MTYNTKFLRLLLILTKKSVNRLINITPMIVVIIMLTLFLSNSFRAGSNSKFDDSLTIAVGKALSIKYPSIVQIDVMDREICAVLQSNDQYFVVTGKKLGDTSIALWLENSPEPKIINVHVDTTPDLDTLAKNLTKFINENFGKKVVRDFIVIPSPTRDKVIVLGRVKSKKTEEAIIDAIKSDQLPLSNIVDNLYVKWFF